MLQMTVPSLLKRAAFKFPDREAIVSEAGRWTYEQFERNANKRAQALANYGIKKGDHVATIFLNGNVVMETFFAMLKLGAIIVPLNVRLSGKELQYIVQHSDATSLILSHEFGPVIMGIKGDLPKVKQYFMSGGEVPEDMVDFEAICEGAPGEDPDVAIEENDIATILYTAGTTGRPKGVTLTHRNWLWVAVSYATDVDIKSGYRVLLVFPLYHAAAFAGLVINVYLGCTSVTMRSFDPERVMELIEEERINRMIFAPTVWNFILQVTDVDRYDTASVRSISSGAEPMPLETKKALLKLFPNANVSESYGMTESGGTISTLDPKRVLEKMGSVGRPYVNVEIRLVDDKGQDVKPGEVGEILARGPNMMQGYYKDPETTATTLRGGWLHTGDLGRLDEEGFLYIVDRKKDMIITGGENVYPREIEEVLYTHPKILEAAVIGLPDPTWGEKIHAVVALKDGETMTEEEVIAYTKEHIASFKKPKSVEFVDRLPRSPAGKVLKRILRDRHMDR